MSVARTGLPHTAAPPPRRTAAPTMTPPRRRSSGRSCPHPTTPAAGGNGSDPKPDSRARVRELVARERATGTRLHAREVAAAAGISERRAYELLRAVRSEGEQP